MTQIDHDILVLISEHGSVADACRVVGVSRQRYYRLRREDAGFRAAADQAVEMGRGGHTVDGMALCLDCMRYRPISKFTERPDSRNGLRRQCKECFNRGRYEPNKKRRSDKRAALCVS